jgi:hypothetical protein
LPWLAPGLAALADATVLVWAEAISPPDQQR